MSPIPRRRASTSRVLQLLLASLFLAGCAASASPSPSLGPSGSPSLTPSPSPTLEPTPTPVPLDQAMLGSRFTILLVGTDSDHWREAAGVPSINTDALIVVSIDATQSSIVMLSLPRDTVDVPLADGGIYSGKVNGIAQRYGLEVLRGAISSLLGIPIEHYIKVDMDDFVRLVNTVGGIDVDVAAPIADPKLGIYLDAGPAHLDGSQALYYSRTRRDSDYARDARQQEVFMALLRKYVDPSLTWNLPGLLVNLTALQTDLELSQIPTLLELGRRASDAQMTATVLQPPRFALFVGYEPGTNRGWVMIPNVAEMRAYAQSLIGD